MSEKSTQMLSDLLAIIHRDGGHRQTKVGTEQAWMEAMMTVPFMLDAKGECTALKAELAEVREALTEARDVLGSIPAPQSWPLWNAMCKAIRRADAILRPGDAMNPKG